MTINFKVGNKYITRVGSTVECVAVWSKPNREGYAVTCLTEDGLELHYKPDGTFSHYHSHPNACDIVAAGPIEIVRWANVYPDGTLGGVFATEDDAKSVAHGSHVVQVKLIGIYKESK